MTVVLFLRHGGAKTPCKWCCVSVICKLFCIILVKSRFCCFSYTDSASSNCDSDKQNRYWHKIPPYFFFPNPPKKPPIDFPTPEANPVTAVFASSKASPAFSPTGSTAFDIPDVTGSAASFTCAAIGATAFSTWSKTVGFISRASTDGVFISEASLESVGNLNPRLCRESY